MVTYPIHLRRDHYGGRDASKRRKATERNHIAVELEDYINQRLLKQEVPIQVYDFADIARATGHSIDSVSELGYSIDGGSNGFTAIKHGMTYDEAIAANNASRD